MKQPQKPIEPYKPELDVKIDLTEKVCDPIINADPHGDISISKFKQTFSPQEIDDGYFQDDLGEIICDSSDEEGWFGTDQNKFSVADLLALIPPGVNYDQVFLNSGSALYVTGYDFMINGLFLSFQNSILNNREKTPAENSYDKKMLKYHESMEKFKTDMIAYEKFKKQEKLVQLEKEANELKKSLEE